MHTYTYSNTWNIHTLRARKGDREKGNWGEGQGSGVFRKKLY